MSNFQALQFPWSGLAPHHRIIVTIGCIHPVRHFGKITGARIQHVHDRGTTIIRYIRAKREAERHLERVGVNGTIIRAPIAYVRGRRRPLFFELVSLLGGIPPLPWTPLKRIIPMPVDVLARGVARIALDENQKKRIFYARDLWRRNTKAERAGRVIGIRLPHSESGNPSEPPMHPVQLLDEDTPFGWTPEE